MARNAKKVQTSTHTTKASKKPSIAILPAAPVSFTQQLFSNVLAADVATFSPQERAHIANGLWDYVQGRKTGTPKFRVYNPTHEEHGWMVDHTVLEIVNDDMPFLVASVTSALQIRGLTIHHVIHPVMLVERDRKGNIVELAKGYAESIIHIQFDHCLDAQIIKDIESDIRKVLIDVRAAVEDWPEMRERMHEALMQTIPAKKTPTALADAAEAQEFMRWMDDNNFTYLGYRDVDLTQKDGRLTSVKVIAESGLGILRDGELRLFGGMRDVNTQRTANLQLYVRRHHILVVTKANVHSRVHRPVPLDAVFIRRFGEDGEILGERLFVGLFTSKSYSQTPDQIPFLRRKIGRVLENSGFGPSSHDGRALAHILNNYPHDELLQIGEEDLHANSLGILQLQERARVAVFVRHDPFERFVTCLIYVPRERYDSKVRARFRTFLEQSFNGQTQDWVIRIDDSLLARIFVTINVPPTAKHPDQNTLESGLREICRTWNDHLRDALTQPYGEARALTLLNSYADAFPLAYQDNVEPYLAVADIVNMEQCASIKANEIVIDLSKNAETGKTHLKLFRTGAPIVLSTTLPLIEHAGLKIEYMGGPYEITPKNSATNIYIHEFVGHVAHKPIASFDVTKAAFEEAFGKLWQGIITNDGINALSLIAGTNWRDIVVLRTFARYLKQLRMPYSAELVVATLQKHPELTQKICALFRTRHDPHLKGNRAEQMKTQEQEIAALLTKIDVLEEDRIMRRYLNLVHASLRTNFFQTDAAGEAKSYLSIKFDSQAVEFMPLPKPLYEIFVYSPRTEAVHLRGGKVARGGIRWSDRRDDFRNEILGLMKAQMVKNTVIVPVGSKGGFVLKQPPAEADKMQAEGIACYRIMMCGLLDITDNRVNGKIVPPHNVVRHDNDDPYLVVAADKGTAKFSDIANGISQEYKFWLDDAFASGGSVGYDHKHMGITARGAWEATKRHFRELDKDIQTTPFTCIGVGDMSGDVFGNGMLLSKHTLMIGAFDHRHIFCDPTPDKDTSYAERQRLFALPRSSWDDYDKKLISKGGGVFPRSMKAIKISPEMKKAYGISADNLAPTELIQTMLKAEVELVYFGGIGTYVKASTETQEEAGDRANEALRINGEDIRAKVVTEGANLGFTQRGRIEYALKGGRINTDAIDNSAGVDTSDHEVNIKILLQKIVTRGTLSFDARNKLLRSMTDDVAALVLQDNYDQTQALSLAEARAVDLLPTHARCIRFLEKTGLLNRNVEFLPDDSDIAERQRMGKGLTRPELAVVMAYAKLWLYQVLLDSDLPDEACLQNDLQRYFPDALQKKYGKDVAQHQLKREIVATILTNAIINRTGSHLVLSLVDQTGVHAATVVRAFILARDALNLTPLWDAIEKLDNKVSAAAQTQMLLLIKKSLTNTIHWALGNPAMLTKIESSVALLKSGAAELVAAQHKKTLAEDESVKRIVDNLTAAKVPDALVKSIALIPTAETAMDLTSLAAQSKGSITDIGEVYFAIGQRLGLDWLINQAKQSATHTPWQREAIGNLVDDLTTAQRILTASLTSKGSKQPSAKRLTEWVDAHAKELGLYDVMLGEWRAGGVVDLAILTIAYRTIKKLVG